MTTHTATAREARALRLYDEGIPSTNPDPDMRALTESHRWGRHYDSPRALCPVCKRNRGE